MTETTNDKVVMIHPERNAEPFSRCPVKLTTASINKRKFTKSIFRQVTVAPMLEKTNKQPEPGYFALRAVAGANYIGVVHDQGSWWLLWHKDGKLYRQCINTMTVYGGPAYERFTQIYI